MHKRQIVREWGKPHCYIQTKVLCCTRSKQNHGKYMFDVSRPTWNDQLDSQFCTAAHCLIMARRPQGKCTVCDNHTTKVCASCIDHLTDDAVNSPTFYCSVACQASHWDKHKATCKTINDVTILYRAGELLQKVFYAYRKVTFSKNVASLEEKDGKLVVHSARSGVDRLFYPFPSTAVSNEDDEKALLAYLGCSDVATMMLPLIKGTMSGKSCRSSCFRLQCTDHSSLRSHSRSSIIRP